MAQVIADRKDIDFVLYEQLEVEQLAQTKAYGEFNRKMIDMIVNEARTFAVKEILPTYAAGDREGVRFEGGQVSIPDCFRKPYQRYVEGEWLAMTESPEWGGQGLPHIVAQAAYEYLVGASFCFVSYGILAHGAGKMIELVGTEQQKQLFLKKLYTGEWAGTMLLTEPQAGSDVGALTTTAIRNPDGTYSLSGSKIFITNGEQDMTENIIHPVLARIEGAPEGTSGISLFIVPKIWVNEDGSLGERNDIVCTGVEEKLGLHASPTCSMTLGGKGSCRGLLLGEENKGMQVMFHMMNRVRLDVGIQGSSNASAAYLYALNYARERLQGKGMAQPGDSSQVPIISHPDVRRMLMWMKSHVDGMRSFVYYVADCFDKAHCAENDEEKTRYDDLIGLLTPVVKSYCSDRGFEVCVQAMQVYGGYGYTREFPVEQLLRDCKITSIYEGTNGIQAMDLLGRKLGMKKGQVFMSFLGQIRETIAQASEIQGLEALAEKLEAAVAKLGEVAVHMGKTAMSPNFQVAFAFASPLLEVMGDVILAWMHLWRATIAMPKKEKNPAFYEGKVLTAEFFISSILPGTLGKMDAIIESSNAVIKMDEKSFGG